MYASVPNNTESAQVDNHFGNTLLFFFGSNCWHGDLSIKVVREGVMIGTSVRRGTKSKIIQSSNKGPNAGTLNGFYGTIIKRKLSSSHSFQWNSVPESSFGYMCVHL